RVRSITDAKGQTYQYTYNPLGWLLTQINADTNHTLSARTDSFFYSAAGLVTKHRDRNAKATSMTYDSLGRVLTLTLADGRVTKYGYDPNGLFHADSNAASLDTSKTDATGLIHTEFTKQAGHSYTITSTSDANGLLQNTVFRSGTTTWDSVSYGYDALFRLNALQTNGVGTTFQYAGDGLLNSWKLPTTGHDSVLVAYSQTHQPVALSYSRAALDGLDELLARDTLDRVVEQSVGPRGSANDTVRFFAYDSSGRLATYADSLSADSLICVPDPHGQDGEHCTPSGGWTFVAQSNYTYDSANNRTDLGAVLTLGNRATTFNGYTLTYDNVGNLTHKSKTGFDQYYYWNSIGQLDSVITNGAKVSFAYDGQGRRVAKVTGGDLRYIYAGSQLIAEVDSSNTTQAADIYRYYPGVDKPHSVKEVSGTYYYLSGVGTPGVVAVIDSTGKIKNRYRYNPWGGLEDSLETVSNVLKFAGREYDPETHLYYNRARYYDPQLARFLSEDPIGQSGGVNQYAYAANNPVTNTDPSGECVPAGQHDAYHTCGAPQADGTPGRGSGGSSPTQAWHCLSTDVNLCMASAVNYLEGISSSLDPSYWEGGDASDFLDVALGCRPLAVEVIGLVGEHCAFRWRFTNNEPTLYGELEDVKGTNFINLGTTVMNANPNDFDWIVLGNADIAANLFDSFQAEIDNWNSARYVLGDSNRFVCTVLKQANFGLTGQQFRRLYGWRGAGAMGLETCDVSG
ncbi:MAG TPA: RHS repeat-associated core domain-containing protein, partial [Gemmatimonadaceae bacterium]|nr:RHS repeat-associated core domain-containing protein [Gemmatimonadaceae bacterium]